MKRKVVYTLIAVLVAAGASIALFAWDLGPGVTPLAKAFLVFFAAIIVLQCIPALLLFGVLIKDLLFGRRDKPALVENQTENSAQL